MQRQIVILAAGKGSRMKSNLPKVMHKIGDKTMLQMVVDNAYAVTKDIVLVYSDHIAKYLSFFEKKCRKVCRYEKKSYLCNRNRETKIANDKVPWMSGLVSGLQNRVRRFESARNLQKRKWIRMKISNPFSLFSYLRPLW